MKMPTRPALISFSLCMGLIACQTTPQTPLSPRPQAQTASSLKQSQAETNPKIAPTASLRIEPGQHNGTSQLHFQIHYPQQAADFQTQALNYAAFSGFQVSIRGIGFEQALHPDTASGPNHTIAAVDCNNTDGCQLSTSISDVPSGENRIAMIVAYDSSGQAIPGSTLAAVFTIAPEQTAKTVELSYRSTPVGQIADGLLQQTLNLLLANLDAPALQAKLDLMMGADDNFPGIYTTHPALLNVPAILNDFKLNNGNIDALIPTNPAYFNAGGTVKGSIEGLLSDDKVSLRLSDPATGEIVGQSNANFQFDHVPAGTWKLIVDAPAGYTIPGLPASVTVTEAGTLDLGGIQVERIQPTITSLGQVALYPGQKLTINGTHFASQAADNVVTIGGVTIPANQITVVSSTHLEVTVPINAPAGTAQVTLTVGDKLAVNQPLVTINALAASDWTNGWGSLGSNTENVLAVTASIQAPDQVFYGSKVGGASLGGIWRCDESVPECTQVETGKAATAGSVQAIVIDPENSDRIYAGSIDKGFLRSTDNGLSWATANNGLTSLDVRSIAVSPKNSSQIFIGTRTGGVFYSANRGDSWTAVNTGLTATDIGSITLFYPVLATDTAYIYAGTKGSGVHRSSLADPAVLSWGNINNNLSSIASSFFLSLVDVTVLVNHPTIPGLQYGAATGGCTDFCAFLAGGTYFPGVWQRTEDSVPANSFWKQIGHNGVNEYDGDGGVHVLEANTNVGLSNMEILDLDFDPLDSDKIYASTKNGIYVSLTPAQLFMAGVDPTSNTAPHNTLTQHFHWRNISTGLPANSVVSSTALHPLKMYIGTNSGLYRAQ